MHHLKETLSLSDGQIFLKCQTLLMKHFDTPIQHGGILLFTFLHWHQHLICLDVLLISKALNTIFPAKDATFLQCCYLATCANERPLPLS